MGIQVEFNPDLALREYGTPGKSLEECLPSHLEARKTYNFLKTGQRNYWLEGEIPLCLTNGNQQLSKPLASIKILEATHYLSTTNEIWTKGKYLVIEVFDSKDPTIHFEGMNKIK